MGTIDRIQYDDRGDVLYIYLQEPEEIDDMVSEEVEDGVLVDRERETGEVVGYTIIDFVGRKDSDEWVDFGGVGRDLVNA